MFLHSHSEAYQDTRTVVEKLSIDVKPKFFYPSVNAASLDGQLGIDLREHSSSHMESSIL